MLVFMTNDEKEVRAEKEVVCMSILLRNMLEDVGDHEEVIPLPSINQETFTKILEYCEYHSEKKDVKEDEGPEMYSRKAICLWDKHYFDTMREELLFNVIQGADILEIKPLLYIALKYLANKLKGL